MLKFHEKLNELLVSAGLPGHLQLCNQSRALSVFFNFFNNKKLFLCIFYKVNNIFLHQSCLKSPLPVELT